jgi:putative endonuclease
MTYTVYALVSEVDSRIYVGFTENISRRLGEHNSGSTRSTKGYRPWYLLHAEECEDRPSARKREKHLKSGVGKEYLKSIRDDQKR